VAEKRGVDDVKLDDAYDGMVHTIRKGFKARRAFGDPIKVGRNVQIIPVAKIMVAAGGKGGQADRAGEDDDESSEELVEGGRFGFKGGVKPIGYIKIKGCHVKWVPICDWEKIAMCCVPVTLFAMHICKHKLMGMEWHKMHHMSPEMREHKKKMMMKHGAPCGKCGMHHIGPCPGKKHHHKGGPEMAEHKKMMMHHHGGPCPKCGMHHMGPCSGKKHHKGGPEMWEHKKKMMKGKGGAPADRHSMKSK